MIPRVEDILIAELERRIVAAVPDTAPGDGLTPETFVTFVEERRIQRNVQEQNNLTVFCMVTAVISAIFFSQDRRYDYSALMADFARNPAIKLGEGVFAKVEIEQSETVGEGPYLNNDAWMFKATYPVFEIEASHAWQTPQVGNVTVGEPDIYPHEKPDDTNEPRGLDPSGGGRFGRRTRQP